MASTPVMIAAGTALAGLGGVAGAALAPADGGDAATTAAKPRVEVRTEVVRKVEHRIKRLKPKHRPSSGNAEGMGAAPAAVAVAPPPQPVSAPAPAPAQPVRTRASGGGGHEGDDDHGGEHEQEHADD